ncbi:MAG TPA: helix-turn-helix domain-containing protein [Thermoanaerobaculia bacterium]|nr:helix-turn-helix domain-containing protein [Thermoanaerobaculia bacterium]
MAAGETSVERVLGELRELLAARGRSVASLERELGWARGYLGDALRGEKRLTLDALLQALAALDVQPAEFFAASLGAGFAASGSWATEVREPDATDPLAALRRGSAASRDPLVREAAQVLTALVEALERKGVLRADDVRAALRP